VSESAPCAGPAFPPEEEAGGRARVEDKAGEGEGGGMGADTDTDTDTDTNTDQQAKEKCQVVKGSSGRIFQSLFTPHTSHSHSLTHLRVFRQQAAGGGENAGRCPSAPNRVSDAAVTPQE
jgi:hypothetical protein